jgi:hypothetical protein
MGALCSVCFSSSFLSLFFNLVTTLYSYLSRCALCLFLNWALCRALPLIYEFLLFLLFYFCLCSFVFRPHFLCLSSSACLCCIFACRSWLIRRLSFNNQGQGEAKTSPSPQSTVIPRFLSQKVEIIAQQDC